MAGQSAEARRIEQATGDYNQSLEEKGRDWPLDLYGIGLAGSEREALARSRDRSEQVFGRRLDDEVVIRTALKLADLIGFATVDMGCELLLRDPTNGVISAIQVYHPEDPDLPPEVRVMPLELPMASGEIA